MEITVQKGEQVIIKRGEKEILTLQKTADNQPLSVVFGGLVTTDSLLAISANLKVNSLKEKQTEDGVMELYLVTGVTRGGAVHTWILKLPKFENFKFKLNEQRLESLVLRYIAEGQSREILSKYRNLSVKKITIMDSVPVLLHSEFTK